MNITGKQTLNELDTLELNCTANARATFTWRKIDVMGNIIDIPSSRSQNTTIDLGENSEGVCISQSKLVVFNVSGSDSGKYICIAESVYSISPANDSYRVNVTGIVKITSDYS